MTNRLFALLRAIVFAAAVVIFLFPGLSGATETNVSPAKLLSPKDRAGTIYESARALFETAPTAERGWKLARAAFDWAEFARDDKQREEIALVGIAAARRAIALDSKSAAARYYLPMNLGQLARTRTIGALKLVDEMEVEFKKVRQMDKTFDFAGPDRNLGLLYLEAPSFSVGDDKKARFHLQKAVELSPDYPENRLNLIEAYLRWGEISLAQQELDLLEKSLLLARKTFQGEEWVVSWIDWDKRLIAIRQKLKKVAK